MPRVGWIGPAGVDAKIVTHAAVKGAHHSEVTALEIIIDGGGSALETGNKGHLEVPFTCTITGWTLGADKSGAIKIDVWRKAFASFPPADGDSLCNGHEPEIAASDDNAQDLDLSDWTSVALVAGDWLAFYIDSVTTITRVTISLRVSKS